MARVSNSKKKSEPDMTIPVRHHTPASPQGLTSYLITITSPPKINRVLPSRKLASSPVHDHDSSSGDTCRGTCTLQWPSEIGSAATLQSTITVTKSNRKFKNYFYPRSTIPQCIYDYSMDFHRKGIILGCRDQEATSVATNPLLVTCTHTCTGKINRWIH